ncbi:MAG: DUF4209 domain-containing protein [Bacteroidetes bacterium]|nr:DUF4209 domain-containing protein [Bacteroidota bacterium]
MKIDEIGNINSLHDFYLFLEEYVLFLEKDHDIVESLLKYKNKIDSEKEKQQLQWEIEVFLFSFIGGKIFSFSTSNGTSIGEVMEYPQLDQYQSEALEFIKRRAKDSTAALLKARYYHVLWKSPLKNKNFAENAIENYITAIVQCVNLIDREDNYSHLIGKLYENLVAITQEAKVSNEHAKGMAASLLSDQRLSFWAKHGIVDDMLKYSKIFKANDFENVLPIFEQRIKGIEAKSDDFMLVNYHLPTAIKVAQKLRSDIKKWHNEIGLAYIRMANKEIDEGRNWIKLDNYRNAINAFRLAGNSSEKEATEQLYFELKPKVRLEEFRVDFDEETVKKLQEFQEELRTKAQNLLKEEPDYIYSLIAKGTFFPKYNDVLDAARNKKATFLDFVTTLHFDGNKNISKHSEDTEERREILEIYGNRIKETLLPFLHYVIVLGTKSGHLTSKNFILFLIHHSWIGKPHVRIDLNGNPEQTNWIFQIAPAISEFFNQVLAWGESKYYNPNFILCTDSLTLKIEGLFRNFSERLNISTSKGKRNGVQEVMAHDVINNEIIRKYFDDSDRLLFDYVFSNEGGLNLRNNIAHCFYNENEYHPDKMLLLLAVLLRLGKYNIKNK